MGAINAVLASHLIENTDDTIRKKIAHEVARIITKVRSRQTPESLMQELSKDTRVIQTNFIAIACDNLGIPTPVSNNVWTRVKNPYQLGTQIDEMRISAAVDVIKKQDGVTVVWPGNSAKIDFNEMYKSGMHITPKPHAAQIGINYSPLLPGHALEPYFPETPN